MQKVYIGLFLLINIFFQLLFLSLPIVLCSLLLIYIVTNDDLIIVSAFVIGLLLDAAVLQILGVSSLYFVCVLFLVSLYEKKFEVHTIQFVTFVSLFASLGYCFIIGFNHVLFVILFSIFYSTIGFTIYNLAFKTKKPDGFRHEFSRKIKHKI